RRARGAPAAVRLRARSAPRCARRFAPRSIFARRFAPRIFAAMLAVPFAAAAQEAEPASHWTLAAGYGHTVPFVAHAETSTNLGFLAPQWSYRLGSVVEAVVEGHFALYAGSVDGYFLGIVPVGF